MWWEVVASDSISSIPGGVRLGKGRSRDKGRTKVVNATWDVWKARNELIFQGKHWCTVRVCKIPMRIGGCIGLRKAYSVNRAEQRHCRFLSFVAWCQFRTKLRLISILSSRKQVRKLRMCFCYTHGASEQQVKQWLERNMILAGAWEGVKVAKSIILMAKNFGEGNPALVINSSLHNYPLSISCLPLFRDVKYLLCQAVGWITFHTGRVLS